jgi:phage baseplate assembly protein W
MSNVNNFGITFPYQEDLTGKFLKMNKTEKDEIKSQLSLLITTQKGQRLFKPDFGMNLEQFLFLPMDEETYSQIREEITATVNKYLKKVTINKVQTNTDEAKNLIGIQISYSISDGILKERDEVNILF